MALFNFFKRSGTPKSGQPIFKAIWAEEGVRVEFSGPLAEPTPDALLDAIHAAGPEDTVLGAYLAQLVNEGLCLLAVTGARIPWTDIYQLQASPEHLGALDHLGLPPVGTLRPLLNSRGSLSDPDFELEISGWTDGTQLIRVDRLIGAVAVVGGNSQMLSAEAWATVDEVAKFKKRAPELRTQREHELAWGQIRKCAERAGVMFGNPYIEKTYILTPDKLRLHQSITETPFGRVRTVAPLFEGAPTEWLGVFDQFNSVQPHYDIAGGDGLVRVVVSEPVRKVLEVIKREMPGRRVAGSKAEMFIHNPWAVLGDSAREVLDEDEFQADRAGAGSVAAVFTINSSVRDGRIEFVDLVITEHFGDGGVSSDSKRFSSPRELGDFVEVLRRSLEEERERFPWDEFDLSIDGDATRQLEQGLQLLDLWKLQPAEGITFEDIYELEGYSSRITGIGQAKAIYVPVFQKEKKEGDKDSAWLPSDLTPMVKVTLQGQDGQVLVPLTKGWVDEFEQQVLVAETNHQEKVRNKDLPTEIPLPQARVLLDGFKSMLNAQEQIKGDGTSKPKEKKVPRETLLVKTNFNNVDYHEARRVSLALPANQNAELPKSLRAEIGLKQHQYLGVAWFQHLISMAPMYCRGALLADDMGLGKTLQLLTTLAWYYERIPSAAPSIIFAPKSLLENWASETGKFFTRSFPEVLILYAEELKSRKQPLSLIDSELQSRGINDLLRPGWVGSAKVVITTYDVLTSYEFSFARQPFSIVICDEAQRIKTPGTLVTLAAKKLKADFRIACTGTPVENSLADLWCLFDFVQPGLLGSLEEFAKIYRRPIECDTDELKQALVRLQSSIAPQTLRRTKADIASDLPNKFFAMKKVGESELYFKSSLAETEMLEIPLTEHQRILYKAGLKKLQDASKESNGRKRARLSFGALHLMKAVCAEPYCLPGRKFLLDQGGRENHLSNSPKLKWLLDRLAAVKQLGEKAIVFTEVREIQAALYFFIKDAFGLKPFIVNGESQGRQTYIDRFSASVGFDVIILSTLAAGAGLNVTAANHVFHFTRAWNPSKEAQATDRAFRIGQARDVIVYCPTTVDDFDTFEVRLDQLLKRKAWLAGTTIDSGGLTSMLNGSGSDATFGELLAGADNGEALPRHFLTLDDIDRLDGEGFEVLVCLLWRKRGFQATITSKAGGDGGIDVVAFKGREGELLQCKSSKANEVGWDAVKEVTAGAARYQARFSGTRFYRLAVTNQRFTSGAVEQAQANQVGLVTREQLEEFLRQSPITNHQYEEALMDWVLGMEAAA